ncbi:hypothetical protein BLNAU_1402 [Blattamonas nauphoetae]|uniref:Uncharacterized protein n=1 Tax=Blattamonas nauphoetae TaxID=2049346 RepID=A0ABQ9YJC4_9EUKA|nr:hypothetical protein BLNAU_1402 [Blattamonas nauphoetae]
MSCYAAAFSEGGRSQVVVGKYGWIIIVAVAVVIFSVDCVSYCQRRNRDKETPFAPLIDLQVGRDAPVT